MFLIRSALFYPHCLLLYLDEVAQLSNHNAFYIFLNTIFLNVPPSILMQTLEKKILTDQMCYYIDLSYCWATTHKNECQWIFSFFIYKKSLNINAKKREKQSATSSIVMSREKKSAQTELYRYKMKMYYIHDITSLQFNDETLGNMNKERKRKKNNWKGVTRN